MQTRNNCSDYGDGSGLVVSSSVWPVESWAKSGQVRPNFGVAHYVKGVSVGRHVKMVDTTHADK